MGDEATHNLIQAVNSVAKHLLDLEDSDVVSELMREVNALDEAYGRYEKGLDDGEEEYQEDWTYREKQAFRP